jgi:hypothetical protein
MAHKYCGRADAGGLGEQRGRRCGGSRDVTRSLIRLGSGDMVWRTLHVTRLTVDALECRDQVPIHGRTSTVRMFFLALIQTKQNNAIQMLRSDAPRSLSSPSCSLVIDHTTTSSSHHAFLFPAYPSHPPSSFSQHPLTSHPASTLRAPAPPVCL